MPQEQIKCYHLLIIIVGEPLSILISKKVGVELLKSAFGICNRCVLQ